MTALTTNKGRRACPEGPYTYSRHASGNRHDLAVGSTISMPESQAQYCIPLPPPPRSERVSAPAPDSAGCSISIRYVGGQHDTCPPGHCVPGAMSCHVSLLPCRHPDSPHPSTVTSVICRTLRSQAPAGRVAVKPLPLHALSHD